MNLVPITVCGSLRYWPDWGLNPGFLNIYQVLYQLSYLAMGFNVNCVHLDWHVSHARYEQIALLTVPVDIIGLSFLSAFVNKALCYDPGPPTPHFSSFSLTISPSYMPSPLLPVPSLISLNIPLGFPFIFHSWHHFCLISSRTTSFYLSWTASSCQLFLWSYPTITSVLRFSLLDWNFD